MPIYEYRCSDCRKKTTVFLRSLSEKKEPVYGHCGGKNLSRLFSRFASPKSEEARMERMANPSAWGGLDENNPRSVAEFAKRMGREMGDEFRDGMDGNFEEMVDREMSGRNSGDSKDSGGIPGADSGLGDD